MEHISEPVSCILLRNALAPRSKSQKKQRIITLYECGVINKKELTALIYAYKLKHD